MFAPNPYLNQYAGLERAPMPKLSTYPPSAVPNYGYPGGPAYPPQAYPTYPPPTTTGYQSYSTQSYPQAPSTPYSSYPGQNYQPATGVGYSPSVGQNYRPPAATNNQQNQFGSTESEWQRLNGKSHRISPAALSDAGGLLSPGREYCRRSTASYGEDPFRPPGRRCSHPHWFH